MSVLSYGDAKVAKVEGVTTEATVIAAPGEGYRLLVTGGALSMASAGTLTLGHALGDEWVETMPLGAGVPLDLGGTSLLAPENEGVKLTATQATSGYLLYAVVPA